MDKEKNKVPYITGFLGEFAAIFTLTVLIFSLCGKLIFNFELEFSSIHTIDGTGISYSTIAQLIGFAVIMAFASRFLFSGYFVYKMLFRWRSLIFLFITLLTTMIFTILFKWFPVNNVHAWLAFIPAFLICYSIAIGLSLLILKLEDKKYNKLLEEYKSRHK